MFTRRQRKSRRVRSLKESRMHSAATEGSGMSARERISGLQSAARASNYRAQNPDQRVGAAAEAWADTTLLAQSRRRPDPDWGNSIFIVQKVCVPSLLCLL
jgi:hypothetical protein